MAKVLLTHSYFLYLDPKQERIGNAFPPLATLYAGAVLREQGFEIGLFDSMLASSPQELKKNLRQNQPDFLVIYDDGFNYLTKMCLTNMREAAFEMIQLAKSVGCKVIISSSDSTDHFGLYLSKGADFVILGEGEITLLELLTNLNEGSSIYGIQGLAYVENDAVVNLGRRPVLRDLDLLPTPAWDLVEIDRYKKLWLDKQGYFSLNVATSRGCTYKCNWCAKPIFGNRYNARSPEHVIEELKLLVKTFGADYIWFCDDIFGLKPGWVTQFADLVEKESLRFKFKIQSRADLLLDDSIVKDLARAGCHEIWIGAESGSQKILDAMDKGTTLSQIYESRKLMKRHGIRTALFLQFGYPGEELEEIKATIKMILDLMPDEIGISVTYPLPGTKLYEDVKSEMKEKTNWLDSDEMAMMFKNKYQPGFYKQLQQYIHRLFRYHKNLEKLKLDVRRPKGFNPKMVRNAASVPYNFVLAQWHKSILNRLSQS